MEDKIKQQNIQRLNISDNTINILNQNKIGSIGQLCRKSVEDLKSFEIESNEIKKIETELQLLGLRIRNSL